MRLVESDTELFEVSIVMTGKQINEVMSSLSLYKLVGHLMPDIYPEQRIALMVLYTVKRQLAERTMVEELATP